MPAKWLSNSSDMSGRIAAALEGLIRTLSRPDNARRMRQVLLALFALWAVLALARLIWALVPQPEMVLPDTAQVINPVVESAPAGSVAAVDVDRLVAWHLFGEAGALTPAAAVVAEPQPSTAAARDGIEKGARETRLDLKLRGVVASTQDGLGRAIIEYKSKQAVYAVEDKLPLPGQVVLAKVMPTQVVLDNAGTYEILQLFEDSALSGQLPSRPVAPAVVRPTRPAPAADSASVDKRADTATTALARSYRERLYQDPQSLAEVVSVSAVRENGELLGYRIAPGKNREQFEQLGFKQGDMVTGVNGIALDDPANTVRLYQTMRSASEAVFDLERDDQALTVSVSLDTVTAAR